jgi:predicted nucleotidyltransferase
MNDATIREAARRIAEKFHPDRIILFDSHARGTMDERSDVDLLAIYKMTGKRRVVATEIDRGHYAASTSHAISSCSRRMNMNGTSLYPER